VMPMTKLFFRCLVALAAFSSAAAWAQNALNAVAASAQGGQEIVRVELAQPLPSLPAGFVVQSPARIALDFPGVVNGTGRNLVELGQGNLRSANIVQSGERTRLVLNLKQIANYKMQIQGSALLIMIDPVAAQVAASPSTPSFAESRNAQLQPLRDVDFRRSADGSGRIVVDLGSNQVGVDIRQQGPQLVVDFLRSSIPESLRRRLDVSDFGTPVQFVSSNQVGDRVRMVIEPRGAWEHSAYQSDNQFVVEVRQIKTDPNKLTAGTGFNGERLSVDFQNIQVRQLIQVLADVSNFNIVQSDTVTGDMTLRLKDVPWDQVLDIILQARSLGMRKSGNVLWIAPAAELAAKEKAELEARAALQALEPLRSQAFQLNYTKAAEVVAQLTSGGNSAATGGGGRLLSQRGSVIAEPRTNQLFVTDVASRIEAVQEMIRRLDVPVRQVMIEARIVEADDKFGKSIGVRLGGSDLRGIRGGDAGYSVGSGNRVAFGGSYAALDPTTRASTGGIDGGNSTFFSLPAVGQGGYSAATFAASLFSASANRFLNLELSALEADGRGKVVSSPRVVTADQVKALIEQGTELPFQQASSSGATSVQFRKASLKLEVTPQITPEGNIILDVDVNKDSVGRATAAGFAIDTKHVKTSVLVENGGTVVIGGIFELFERNEETKVPVMGDLPWVGNFFKAKQKTLNKSEMLIFITPKVISDRQGTR
jgi:type IV pilus assembly protein PilQ